MTVLLVISGCQSDDVSAAEDSKESGVAYTVEESEVISAVSEPVSHKVTQEEAQQTAVQAMSTLMIGKGKANNFKISSVKTNSHITNEGKGKNGIPGDSDTVDIYSFNFQNGDQKGFAIISGDDRIDDIIAVSANGNLGDTIENPGLGVILSRLPDYIEDKIEEHKEAEIKAMEDAFNKLLESMSENERDSILKERDRYVDSLRNADADAKGKSTGCMGGGCVDEMEDYYTRSYRNSYYSYYYRYYQPTYIIKQSFTKHDWDAYDIRGTKLSTEWGQKGPFNSELDHFTSVSCGGGKPYTGCVATALGQIMAYHKHPSSYNGYAFKWDEMPSIDSIGTSGGRTSVGNLMGVIGQKVYMNFGCDASGTQSVNCLHTLAHMGYNRGDLEYYAEWKAVNELSYNRPFYIDGCSFRERKSRGWWIFKTYYWDYDQCHAWVVDQYVKQRRKISWYDVSYRGGREISRRYRSRYEYQTLLHHNFGWNGNDNGYYLSGVFDTENGRLDDGEYDKSLKSKTNSGTPYNFQYAMSMIGSISPK